MCSFAFLIASPQSVTIPPLEHPSSEANLGAVKCMPDIQPHLIDLSRDASLSRRRQATRVYSDSLAGKSSAKQRV